MAKDELFRNLATELTHLERQKILSKILQDSELDPKYKEYIPVFNVPESLEKDIPNLSIIQRFFLWFEKLFSFAHFKDALENALLKALGTQLAYKSGLVSKNLQFLTAKTKRIVEDLASLSRFFLNSVFTADSDKNAFYAFLARVTLSESYVQAMDNINPHKIAFELKTQDEDLIRKEISSRLDTFFKNIDHRAKEKMDINLQTFHLLLKLCDLDFPGFSYAFVTRDKAKVCETALAIKFLQELSSVVYSFKITPDISLFKALYLFVYYAEGRLNTIDEADLKKWVDKGCDLLVDWQGVAADFRLRDLTAFVSGDYLYSPEKLENTGGWIRSYRRFWDNYSNQRLKEYFQQQQYKEQLQICANFYSNSGFPWLANYGTNWERVIGYRPRFSASIAFANCISNEILTEMSYQIKIVIDEGKFYKKMNSTELKSSYQIIQFIRDAIIRLEKETLRYLNTNPTAVDAASLSDVIAERTPSAFEQMMELAESQEAEEAQENLADGEEYVEKKEAVIVMPSIDYFKNNPLANEADFLRVVERILVDFKYTLRTLSHVLHGVLHGEVGGKYDTISNLSYLGGGRSQIFIDNLNKYEERLGQLALSYDKLNDYEMTILK